MTCHFAAPGIAWLPSRCKQDKVFPFAPFTDRGRNHTIKGVILIRLVDHLTLPVVERKVRTIFKALKALEYLTVTSQVSNYFLLAAVRQTVGKSNIFIV